MVRRIVLDTDMGSDVDDALCLALALASPEIELVAVTHVTKDTTLRARISRRILDLAGRPDVPVYAGRSDPFAGGTNRFVWFGNEGAGIVEPTDDATVDGEDAVDALLRLFAAEEGLELVAVGPMTNLAAALQRDATFAAKVARLTVMGGHLREISYRGTVFPFGVDYNLCSDPEASMAVLRADVPTRLVTGDVTLRTWLTNTGLDAIAAAGGPVREVLVAAVHHWTPIMYRLFGGGEATGPKANVAFLHDPLALACVFDESFCTFEDLPIEAAVSDGLFRTFERLEASAVAHTMRCAVDVDAPRFHDFFVERLRSL